MKNKIFIFLILPVFVLFNNGCSEKLDTVPRQSQDADITLTSVGGLENAVTGAYNELQDDDLMGADYIQCGELFTDHIFWTGSFTSYSEISVKSIVTNNTEPGAMWPDAYQAILSANKIIEAIEGNTVSGPAYDIARDRLLGSAYFIRAASYFQLAVFFCQPSGYTVGDTHLGVPIITDATNSYEDAIYKPSRNSVSDVYNQIISDFTMAESLSPGVNQGRATSWAATAFLSRVYMQQGDFTNAAAKANEIIQAGVFSEGPINSYSVDFADNEIFEIHMVSDDNLSSNNNSLNDYWSPKQRAEITVEPSEALFDQTNDLRYNDWFYTSLGATWTRKYEDADWNITILRFEEMLLNRAEALAELGGNDTEAVTLLNRIRTRAGLGDYTYVDNASLINEIRDETIREFIHEGHAFLDYKRWRKTDIGYSSPGLIGSTQPWDFDQNIFPIPQTDMDANENLVQNPGF